MSGNLTIHDVTYPDASTVRLVGPNATYTFPFNGTPPDDLRKAFADMGDKIIAEIRKGSTGLPPVVTPPATVPGGSAGDTVGTLPYRSQALVEHFGVDTLPNWPQYIGQRPAITKAVQDLGVLFMRSSASNFSPAYDAQNEWMRNGIKMLMDTDPNTDDHSTPEKVVALLKRNYPDNLKNIYGIEGKNEPPDNNWSARGAEAIAQMRDPIRALLGPQVQFWGPSLIHGLDGWQAIARFAGSLDVFNIHPYPGSRFPEDAGGSLTLGYMAEKAAAAGDPNKPFGATETGWHTAVGTTSGFRPVSEKAAAAYTPRLLAHNFSLGKIVKSFIFEMLDRSGSPDQEAHFGFLRSNGERKPHFYTMANLIKLMSDPTGSTFKPSLLNYRIDGGDRALAFARGDGSFMLIAWQAVSVFNDTGPGTMGIDLNIAAKPAVLNLTRSFSKVDSTRLDSVNWQPLAKAGVGATYALPVQSDLTLVRLIP